MKNLIALAFLATALFTGAPALADDNADNNRNDVTTIKKYKLPGGTLFDIKTKHHTCTQDKHPVSLETATSFYTSGRDNAQGEKQAAIMHAFKETMQPLFAKPLDRFAATMTGNKIENTAQIFTDALRGNTRHHNARTPAYNAFAAQALNASQNLQRTISAIAKTEIISMPRIDRIETGNQNPQLCP